MKYIAPFTLTRALNLINDIFALYQSAKLENDYKKFVTGKGDSKDASHRLRLVHDEFLQDAFKNDCVGTIYRTKGMKELKDTKKQIHCEHVIPNNILIKYIYYNLEPKNLSELANFIFDNRIICGVSKSEKNLLNKLRDIEGTISRWTRHHPHLNFLDNSVKINFKTLAEVKPFIRYQNSGLEVYNLSNTEIPIDIDSFSMQDHWDLTSSFQKDIKSIFEIELNQYLKIENY